MKQGPKKMSDNSPLLRDRGLKLFAKRSESPANSARKNLQDSPQTPKKERDGAQKQRGGGDSPGLRHEPPVKLSDVSIMELTPNAALSNFRARKKTFGEYLAPLTGMFTSRRTSALERLSFRQSPSKISAEEDERKRVRELMFGTPMRRFSLQNSHNIPRSGTLRVRVIACTSNKLKSNTTLTRKNNNSPLAEIRKVSDESTGSNSSGAGGANQPLGNAGRGLLRQKRPEIQYYVELELGAARGRTSKKPKHKGSRRGEVRWDDSNAWVRLFVPGVEEGADPILLAVSEAAKQASGEGRIKSRRPLQVLHLRVMCVVRGSADDDSEVHTPLFESAVELDRLIAKGAPRLLELPLVNKEDPEDEDLGILTIETRFERLNPRRLSNDDLKFVEAAENLAAESASVLILAGRTPNLGLGTTADEMRFGQQGVGRHGGILRDDDDTAVSPILMVPSAAAYLTTVAAGLVPTSLPLNETGSKSNPRMSQKLRIVYEHDEGLRASWPLGRKEEARHRFETVFSDTSVEQKRLRQRFSCPNLSSLRLKTEGGELLVGANTEQLQSLREGWRMWRMAHRSQLQPSHRAKDLAGAGERFINRANSVGSGGNSPVDSLKVQLQHSPTSAGANPPRSPRSLFDLESQPSTQRARALFELGGDSYDVSNYLDDHPHQRAFLNSISARAGKISRLEQQASLSDENAFDQSQPGSISATRTKPRRKPSVIVPPVRPWSRRRIAVVTGATSGIGEVIGRKLCSMGVKKLIILVRTLSSGRAKALEWTEKFKNVEVDVIQCDLRDMKDTNAAADHVRDLLAPGERIDLLVLCAACVSNESTMPEKKEFEETFAVNYMANFLLVHALFDVMERSSATSSEDEARIIFAGCAAVPPFGNRIDLDDLQAEKRGIGQLGVAQYIHTKTMLICFASELARRLADRHCFVTANVFFPGAVKSKLADRVLEAFNPVIARLADAAYGLTEGVLVRSPEQGAALALHLCSSPALVGVNGKVFHSGTTGIVTDFDPHPHFGIATNMELSRKLWAISGKMLNQALGKESRVTEWWGYFKPARPTQTKSQGTENHPERE